MKKAFSLLELIIVLVLLVILYGIFFSNFKLQVKTQNQEITLENLKKSLLSQYEFDNQLQLVCLKYESVCYVFLDGKIDKNNSLEIKFPQDLQAYYYQKELKKLEFQDIKFENLESYEVLFEYNIFDNRSDSLVVQLTNKVAVLHAFEEPTILSDVNQIDDMFKRREEEVKDAF